MRCRHYIGTSGWSYGHWHGVLYPHGGQPAERLGLYTQRFDTVELNSSFYRWPSDWAFNRWRRSTPAHFVVSVKAPGLLTHVQRLYSPERWLTRIALALRRLHEKFGVLLVQLSPLFPRDDARLDYFLAQRPPWLRMALEFRHHSWHCHEVFELLRRHAVAYCTMSGAHLPCILDATAPFVYLRLHGPDPHGLYCGLYSENDLHWWADRIREWDAQGRPVYCYFNNDMQGFAVRNAERLRALLGL